MSEPRLCACPEPEADIVAFRSSHMHVHAGCRVYHAGRECTMENGKDSKVEIVEGNVTAKATLLKKRRKSAEQTYIPGTEPVKEARDARMALTRTEVERRGALMAAMKKAGIVEYGVDGHEATLDVEETVKAKLRGDDADEVDAEEGPGQPRKTRRGRGREAAAGVD